MFSMHQWHEMCQRMWLGIYVSMIHGKIVRDKVLMIVFLEIQIAKPSKSFLLKPLS